jgi:hypothetical protein
MRHRRTPVLRTSSGAPSKTRTYIVSLEGSLPSFGRGELERANGVEPSRASLATMPRTMRARVIGACRRIRTCCLRIIGPMLIRMSLACELVRAAGIEPASSEFQARPSAADLHPDIGHADRNCTRVKSLCRRPPIAAQPRREMG